MQSYVVLKFNSNGFPLYWFDKETLSFWKRIDKNSSERYSLNRLPQDVYRTFRKLVRNGSVKPFNV